jgi:toxin HigB-1
MIKSSRNEVARAAWARRFVKGVPHDVLRIGNRKLLQLHNARSLQDLRAPPGNRLEALAAIGGASTASASTSQWRICFVWDGDGARDVEIVDYHA